MADQTVYPIAADPLRTMRDSKANPADRIRSARWLMAHGFSDAEIRDAAIGVFADAREAAFGTFWCKLPMQPGGENKLPRGGVWYHSEWPDDARTAVAPQAQGRAATVFNMEQAGLIGVDLVRELLAMPDLSDKIPSTPADPLDAVIDGVTLRELIKADQWARTDGPRPCRMSPAQRAAVSAHWSAELRARVAASNERERARVVVDLDEP